MNKENVYSFIKIQSHKIFIRHIKFIFKYAFLIKEILESRKYLSSLISSYYKGNKLRNEYKKPLFLYKLLKFRKESVKKFYDYYQFKKYREKVKYFLNNKLEFNYMITSDINDCNFLYFTSFQENGLEENIYFEKCDIINQFAYYIDKNEEDLNNKILRGYFTNDNDCHVLDNKFEIDSEKNENIINITSYINTIKNIYKKYDEINKEFLKKNKRIYNPFILSSRRKKELKMKRNKTSVIINFDNDKENINDNIKIKRNSTNANLLLSNHSSKSILRPAKSFKSIKSIKTNLKKKISFGQIELLS
jgi:hypothetical protein